MHMRSIACASTALVLSSASFAGAGSGATGNGAELFVLPPILLTQETANSVRVIHRRGDGTGGGNQDMPGGNGGDGGTTTEEPPRNPYLFGAATDFQGEINNRLGRSTDFLVIQIIPDPEHDYAPGSFESLSFNADAGVGIDALATEATGDDADPSFTFNFSADRTRVRIDFAEGETLEAGEALNFSFSVLNSSGEGVPLGFQFIVPTPGSAALLGIAGLFVSRRRRVRS